MRKQKTKGIELFYHYHNNSIIIYLKLIINPKLIYLMIKDFCKIFLVSSTLN